MGRRSSVADPKSSGSGSRLGHLEEVKDALSKLRGRAAADLEVAPVLEFGRSVQASGPAFCREGASC